MAEGYLPHTYARPDDSEIGLYIPRLRDGPITAQAYHNSSGPRTSSSAPAPAYLPQGNRHTYLSTPALATDLTSTYSYSSAEPASATSATSTTSVPPLVLAFPSPSPSGSADSERPAVTVPTKPSKRKKTKEQIPLAGDQPLTTQGTSRQRVYLACSQWCVRPASLPNAPSLMRRLVAHARSAATARSRCVTTASSAACMTVCMTAHRSGGARTAHQARASGWQGQRRLWKLPSRHAHAGEGRTGGRLRRKKPQRSRSRPRCLHRPSRTTATDQVLPLPLKKRRRRRS